jgi:NitT/TauT family transport system substrate-binding protein
VKGLVQANVEAIQLIEDDPATAKADAQAGLVKAGAPSLDQLVVDEAWSKLTFSVDPVASSLAQGAANAYALGLLERQPTDLRGLFQLDQLNDVLGQLQIPVIQVTL